MANVFLDVLLGEKSTQTPFEYDVPILNQQGEMSGRLRVRLERAEVDYRGESPKSDEEETHKRPTSKRMMLRLAIERAYDLPVNLNNLVFCKYRWWWSRQQRPIIVSSKDSTDSAVFFDHEADFILDDEEKEDAIEFCADGGALSIEVLAHRTDIAKSMNDNSTRALKIYQDRMVRLNQVINYISQNFLLDPNKNHLTPNNA